MSIDILVFDRQHLFREALCSLLKSRLDNSHIVQVSNTGDFNELLQGTDTFSLILPELSAFSHFGAPFFCDRKQLSNDTKIIALSSSDDAFTFTKAMVKGADGLISRTASAEQISTIIERVLAGESLVLEMSEASHFDASRISLFRQLSPRHQETMEKLALGMSNKEIAREMNISPSTVREYVSKIIRIFGASNRTQAAIKAKGFIS